MKASKLSFIFLSLVVASLCSFALLDETKRNECDDLIDEEILKPLLLLHDPANIKMFSRAYIGSIWKCEMKSKPTGKQKHYEYQLREFRGAFILDQYKVKVVPSEKKVEVENWKTGEFISAADWIEFYKNQKGKK